MPLKKKINLSGSHLHAKRISELMLEKKGLDVIIIDVRKLEMVQRIRSLQTVFDLHLIVGFKKYYFRKMTALTQNLDYLW